MGGGSGAMSPGKSATGGSSGDGAGRVVSGGVGLGVGVSRGGEWLVQDSRLPTIAAHPTHLESRFMVLILLEALGALLLLVGIVWWTMFSGRDKGELREAPPPEPGADNPRQD
jgi:hypothetical protein